MSLDLLEFIPKVIVDIHSSNVHDARGLSINTRNPIKLDTHLRMTQPEI